MSPRNCRSAWQRMHEAAATGPVRNYTELIDMGDFVVETELFPRAALVAYSAKNMEEALTPEQRTWINEERGGAQGDYHEGMAGKIANVVDCLAQFPRSKRAVIAVSNRPMAEHSDDAEAKCMREIHLYLDDDNRLSATVLLRAQAASLFPKNIHMVGSIMTRIAEQLPGRPALGTVFYVATLLVADRS